MASSTRCAPLVRTSSGSPPTSKTRLLAIAPTGDAELGRGRGGGAGLSGSTRTSPAAPAARSRRTTSATRGWVGVCAAVMPRSCHRRAPRAPPGTAGPRRPPGRWLAVAVTTRPRTRPCRLDAVGGVRSTSRCSNTCSNTGGSARRPGPSCTSCARFPAGPVGGPAGEGPRVAESVMSRVLVGAGGRVGEEVQVEQGPSGPAQFWRGQTRYAVGELLDSWVETAPWWQARLPVAARRRTWSPPGRCGGSRRSGPAGRGWTSPGCSTCRGSPPRTVVARPGARLMGAARALSLEHLPVEDQLPLPPPLPARPPSCSARRTAGWPRRPPAPTRAALRHRAPGRPARRRRGAGRPHPARAGDVAGRAAPGCCSGRSRPELGEWAAFFAAGAAKRAAAEAGLTHAVTEREADDLVRDVGTFLGVVETTIGRCRRSPPAAPRRRPPPSATGARVAAAAANRRARRARPELGDPFVHLHVASGYSMRYGANHPADLVARAAEHGMGALALTDRDGLYGAVKFALACRSAGIRPIFGVDLAVGPAAGGDRRAPGRVRAADRAPGPAPGRTPVPGPRWGQRRPAAAPGHLPRPGRRRLGVAVPADQRHPPAAAPGGSRSARWRWPPSTPRAASRCWGPTPRWAARWPPAAPTCRGPS